MVTSFAKYRTKSEANALKTASHLRSKGARDVSIKEDNSCYEVQYLGPEELVKYGRHGLDYSSDELEYILLSYIAGCPTEYISYKTKRTVAAIQHRLRSFGIFVYDCRNNDVVDLLRALGWLAVDKRSYYHTYSDSFLPGTDKKIIDSSNKKRISRTVEHYMGYIGPFKSIVKWLDMSDEAAWRILQDVPHRMAVHDALVNKSIDQVISRCDLFGYELFGMACRALTSTNKYTELHALMRHYYSGVKPHYSFDACLYMSTFDRLEIGYSLERIKNIVSLRLLRVGISNLLDFFYRGHHLNKELMKYMSSVIGEYDAPSGMGFDFKSGFKSFLDTGIIDDFHDDPPTHNNTFLRWVKIFKTNGGYDRYMYSYIYPDDPYPEDMVKSALNSIFIKDAGSSNHIASLKIDEIRGDYKYDFWCRDCCYPRFIEDVDECDDD